MRTHPLHRILWGSCSLVLAKRHCVDDALMKSHPNLFGPDITDGCAKIRATGLESRARKAKPLNILAAEFKNRYGRKNQSISTVE